VLRIGANIRIVLSTFVASLEDIVASLRDIVAFIGDLVAFIGYLVASVVQTMVRRHTLAVVFIVLVIGIGPLSVRSEAAGIPNQFFLVNGGWTVPDGKLSTDLRLAPGPHLALGYLFAPNRTLMFGASGHWMHFSAKANDEVETTILQMTALVRLKLLKHGTTPYLDLEGGMTFVTHIEEVRPCFASSLGLRIPLEDNLDIDFRGRLSWSPAANNEILTYGMMVGIAYALPRD